MISFSAAQPARCTTVVVFFSVSET